MKFGQSLDTGVVTVHTLRLLCSGESSPADAERRPMAMHGTHIFPSWSCLTGAAVVR